MSYAAHTLKEYYYMIDFVLQAKVNNSSLIGLGYTQILKPGMYRLNLFDMTDIFF